ncbi:hypothetical protein [Terasakiella pusilla]|uniref:hypothetical protein n=1 Tax=Terasakiella pusilla TaxID=64973 RepID=UPI003AA96816
MYRLLSLTFLFVGFLLLSSPSSARTVTCSAVGTVDPTAASMVYYDPQRDVCKIKNVPASEGQKYQMFITPSPTSNWLQGWVDEAANGSISLKGHSGCDLGGSIFIAPSGICSRTNLNTGTYTNVLKHKNGDGVLMTMTAVVAFVRSTSATVTSAKVVIEDRDDAGNTAQKPGCVQVTNQSRSHEYRHSF